MQPAVPSRAVRSRAEARPAVARPAVARPAVARPAVARPAEARPAARRAVRPREARRAAARPAEARPAVAPAEWVEARRERGAAVKAEPIRSAWVARVPVVADRAARSPVPQAKAAPGARVRAEPARVERAALPRAAALVLELACRQAATRARRLRRIRRAALMPRGITSQQFAPWASRRRVAVRTSACCFFVSPCVTRRYPATRPTTAIRSGPSRGSAKAVDAARPRATSVITRLHSFLAALPCARRCDGRR